MLWIALAGCTGEKPGDDTAETDTDTDTDTDLESICPDPVEVSCVDEMILDLSLHDDKVSNADVTSESDGDDTRTYVDASGGGSSSYTNRAWTYIRFETDGTVSRVEIDDETALEDQSWDLGLRRFIIRVNGGDSGPSCVGAAALPRSSYADLTEIPENVEYLSDDFYDDECVLQEDDSGFPGSPLVALGDWWTYVGCVQATDIPFLIQLDDGRVIKLMVESYYDDLNVECDAQGSTSALGGFIWMRWAEM